MAEIQIPLLDKKIFSTTGAPEWINQINPETGWSILPHRKVEGKQVYRLAAYNQNLGPHGVTMSIIEKPEHFEEKARLSDLNTFEVQWDDFDPDTMTDNVMVGLLHLEKATGFTQQQLTELFTDPGFFEEIGGRYARKFLSLNRDDIDVTGLFRRDDGVDQLTNWVFSDLVENEETSHEEVLATIIKNFQDRNK